MMKINTAIFDMDGLLIDSEPLWKVAANEVFEEYGFTLTDDEYAFTVGMRTYEFVQHWIKHFNRSEEDIPFLNDKIINIVIKKIEQNGEPMPGATELVKKFKENNFKVGIASSSPLALIEVVAKKLQIEQYVDILTSAEDLEYGKPHPQVFIECAKILGTDPVNCIVFEDSFNGMIAAKAARMVCVVVPEKSLQTQSRWHAADLQLASLLEFDWSTISQ